VDESYDVPDTARLIKFIRAIDSAFIFVKTLQGIKAGTYLFLKIKEVLVTFELGWENWQV
jgi:hypothetical protein